MDTSKEYIKMCEKAEEIQREWKPQTGDWFICSSVELCASYDTTDKQLHVWEFDRVKYREKENCIWLPRQDQLQEMVRDIRNDRILLYDFYHWIYKQNPDFLPDNYSMEQLWLAFVMKERYSKQWSGEEWVIK